MFESWLCCEQLVGFPWLQMTCLMVHIQKRSVQTAFKALSLQQVGATLPGKMSSAWMFCSSGVPGHMSVSSLVWAQHLVHMWIRFQVSYIDWYFKLSLVCVSLDVCEEPTCGKLKWCNHGDKTQMSLLLVYSVTQATGVMGLCAPHRPSVGHPSSVRYGDSYGLPSTEPPSWAREMLVELSHVTEIKN